MPCFTIVPENDKRNKYIVKVDGLDDFNRLAEPRDSDKTLKVTIMGRFICIFSL